MARWEENGEECEDEVWSWGIRGSEVDDLPEIGRVDMLVRELFGGCEGVGMWGDWQ